MKKIMILGTVFGLSLLLAGEAPAEEVFLTLKPGSYEIQKDAEGADRILMNGYRNSGAAGEPVLPSKMFTVLVDPDIDWRTLDLSVLDSVSEVLPGRYTLQTGAPDAASKDGETLLDWGQGARVFSEGKNQDVYDRNAFFPSDFVELLPYSQMRKWKFVRVRFHPFQHNPVTGELRLVQRARIEIRYERTAGDTAPVAPQDQVMAPLVSTMVQNYATGRSAYETRSSALAAAGPSDYVIVTANATVAGSAALSAFITHKQARGHKVRVVTETDFSPLVGQAPNHRAEKIRQWLINNYVSLGIEYVLLIGDPTPYEKGEGDIPMKMCWPRLGAGTDEESPTDAFYADLTGNWDPDRDGTYGEWSDYATPGGVDFSMEVWVGRIPVYGADTQSLDSILRKIVEYENAGTTAWRKNVLLPMSFATPTYDGAPLAEQMKTDFLNARNFEPWTQYQQGSGACALNSGYASDEELRGGSVVRDRWASAPYGIVSWWGHGSVTSASVGAEGCWEGTLFSILQNASLNDDYPAFTFQCSCTNGFPENSRNLQYALLARGGIGTVSASRVSWFNTGTGYGQFDGSSTNSGIGYEYVDRLTQSMAAGEALYQAKLAVVGDIGTRNSRLMNLYDFNLYGDPSLAIGGCDTDAECDDGLWCNGEERCVSGQCAAGAPVNCNDGNACTDDLCDETLNRCTHPCGAEGPGSACCGNAACDQEAVCNDECADRDGDGYGSPASMVCPHMELDCDDTDPDVHPGTKEIEDNGIDDDCRPDTPVWGAPASVLGVEYSRPSRPVNFLVMFLVPALALMVLRGKGLRKRVPR